MAGSDGDFRASVCSWTARLGHQVICGAQILLFICSATRLHLNDSDVATTYSLARLQFLDMLALFKQPDPNSIRFVCMLRLLRAERGVWADLAVERSKRRMPDGRSLYGLRQEVFFKVYSALNGWTSRCSPCALTEASRNHTCSSYTHIWYPAASLKACW